MFQQTILIGNIGEDPKFAVTPNTQTSIVEFSVATNKRWKDKNTGQQQEKTVWHHCKAYGNLAEIINQYCHKGSKVMLTAEADDETWNDKQTGQKQSRRIYTLSELKMLDSRESAPASSQPEQPYQQQAPQHHQQSNNQAQQQAPAQTQVC